MVDSVPTQSSSGAITVHTLTSNVGNVPGSSGYGFIVSPGNNTVDVIDNRAQVYGSNGQLMANPNLNQIIAYIPLGPTDFPEYDAVTTDDSRVYVTTNNGIAVIDAVRFQQISSDGSTTSSGNTPKEITLPTGAQPYQIIIDPADQYAYVTDKANPSIYVIDINPNSPTFNTCVKTIALTDAPLGLRGLAITADGSRLYAAAPVQTAPFLDVEPGQQGHILVIDLNQADKNTTLWTQVITLQTNGYSPDGITATVNPNVMLFTDYLDDAAGFNVIYGATTSNPTITSISILWPNYNPDTTVFAVHNANDVAVTSNGQFAFISAFNVPNYDIPSQDHDTHQIGNAFVPPAVSGSTIGIIQFATTTTMVNGVALPTFQNPQIVAATRAIPAGFPEALAVTSDNQYLIVDYAGVNSAAGSGATFVYSIPAIAAALAVDPPYMLENVGIDDTVAVNGVGQYTNSSGQIEHNAAIDVQAAYALDVSQGTSFPVYDIYNPAEAPLAIGGAVRGLALENAPVQQNQVIIADEGQAFSGNVATLTVPIGDTPAGAAPIIYWGDGTSSMGTLVSAGGGQYYVNGSHTWNVDGTYEVVVALGVMGVTDDPIIVGIPAQVEALTAADSFETVQNLSISVSTLDLEQDLTFSGNSFSLSLTGAANFTLSYLLDEVNEQAQYNSTGSLVFQSGSVMSIAGTFQSALSPSITLTNESISLTNESINSTITATYADSSVGFSETGSDTWQLGSLSRNADFAAGTYSLSETATLIQNWTDTGVDSNPYRVDGEEDNDNTNPDDLPESVHDLYGGFTLMQSQTTTLTRTETGGLGAGISQYSRTDTLLTTQDGSTQTGTNLFLDYTLTGLPYTLVDHQTVTGDTAGNYTLTESSTDGQDLQEIGQDPQGDSLTLDEKDLDTNNLTVTVDQHAFSSTEQSTIDYQVTETGSVNGDAISEDPADILTTSTTLTGNLLTGTYEIVTDDPDPDTDHAAETTKNQSLTDGTTTTATDDSTFNVTGDDLTGAITITENVALTTTTTAPQSDENLTIGTTSTVTDNSIITDIVNDTTGVYAVTDNQSVSTTTTATQTDESQTIITTGTETDSGTITVTGNERSGDYTKTANMSTSITTTSTETDDTETIITTVTETDSGISTVNGNQDTGNYTMTDSPVTSTTTVTSDIDDDDTTNTTVKETDTGSGTQTGNQISGAYAITGSTTTSTTTTSTETNDGDTINYTVTEADTDTSTETGNELSGDYTNTNNTTASSTIVSTETDEDLTTNATVTGTDTDTSTGSGNTKNGAYTTTDNTTGSTTTVSRKTDHGDTISATSTETSADASTRTGNQLSGDIHDDG